MAQRLGPENLQKMRRAVFSRPSRKRQRVATYAGHAQERDSNERTRLRELLEHRKSRRFGIFEIFVIGR